LHTGFETIKLESLLLYARSAWKRSSRRFVCDISYNAVAVGEKRA